MASQDYLIAIALIEQNNVRAMPLGGKEIKEKLEEEEGNLIKLGEEVILNLLLRVFQRSDEGALKENCSLDDFSIIFLNHFQLLGITIPGQTAHKHKTNTENK